MADFLKPRGRLAEHMKGGLAVPAEGQNLRQVHADKSNDVGQRKPLRKRKGLREQFVDSLDATLLQPPCCDQADRDPVNGDGAFARGAEALVDRQLLLAADAQCLVSSPRACRMSATLPMTRARERTSPRRS